MPVDEDEAITPKLGADSQSCNYMIGRWILPARLAQ